MGIYAADCETSGLLAMLYEQESPKLHNFCAVPINEDKIFLFNGNKKKAIQSFLDEGHTLVIHNGKTFDEPAMEFLGYDLSACTIIDSLALSWYLEPDRIRHGLAEYGEEFGVPKPVIEDWENQTQEEYNHRVIEDCKIQKKLWLRQVGRLKALYGDDPGSYDKLISFLMWKMDQQRIQQDCQWKLDVPASEILQEQLAKEIELKVEALKLVMPQVPITVVRHKPAKAFKKNGELSATGEKWKELTESLGYPFEHQLDIKVVTGYEVGNPSSHTQMKAWLDSLGWMPETFKYVKEGDGTMRKIPQINLKGGLICQSVVDLIPKCEGIEHIAGLGILNHRHSIVKGFLRDATEDGYLTARNQGFTNTLRLQHRELVNLPSVRVKYGKELRGLLIARDGHVLLGSDLNSLEDRLKHHFQWKIDPEYVKSQMEDGFDPHLSIGVSANMITVDEMEFYKWYKKEHK